MVTFETYLLVYKLIHTSNEPEVHSESSQTSKKELFAKMVICEKPLTIFTIIGFWARP